jgi:hypothetical protein
MRVFDGEVAAPGGAEGETAVFDVLVIVIVIFETADKLIGGAVEAHEGVEEGLLQAGDAADERAVEAIINILVLLLLEEAALEGEHLAVLTGVEDHVEVEADAAVGTADDIVGGIVEDFAVLVAVLEGVIAIGFGLDDDDGQTVDRDGETHVQGIGGCETADGDLAGMTAEVGKIDGVVDGEAYPIVPDGIGHGACAGIAKDADAGHGEELGLIEDGTGDPDCPGLLGRGLGRKWVLSTQGCSGMAEEIDENGCYDPELFH